MLLHENIKTKLAQVVLMITTVWCCSGSASTADPEVTAGPFITCNFYSTPGIRFTVAHERFLGGHPQATVSYSTSRMSWWNGPNALVTDQVLLTVSWIFRIDKRVSPFAGIDVGHLRYDREDDELFAPLDNSFFLMQLNTGVRFSLFDGVLHPSIDAGYVLHLKSITFPFFIGTGICYNITKGIYK